MTVMSDTALQAAPATKARGYWATVGRRISRDKVSMVCALVLVLIFLSALCAPWLGLADPYQGSMIRRLRHIGTPNYPLGTDELGRDMLARLIYGGRLSLIIGILPVMLALMTEPRSGSSPLCCGRLTPRSCARSTCLAPSRRACCRFLFPGARRGHRQLHRSRCHRVRAADHRVAEASRQRAQMDFVEARARPARVTIMRVHMLGNVLGPIFVYATGLISVSMILAAGLSFLGLGTKPPEPEWGLMLNTLRTAIYVNPWVAALPGVMIFAVSICFNLLSDGMRSAMDIRN